MTKLDTRQLRTVLAAVDRPEGVTYGDEARFERDFNHETIGALLSAAEKVEAALAVLNNWWQYDDWSLLLAAVRDVLEPDMPADA